MKTLVTDSPEEAASFIRSGDIAAFPTETVYGLGGNAFSEVAVGKIYAAKGRPPDNPLIIHVADREQIDLLAEIVPAGAALLIERFFPGALTVILKKRKSVPDVVTAGLDSVGVRMPAHPVAHQFLKACGVPVAAPSANLSGKPSPTSWEAVLHDLGYRIPCILRGGRTPVGLESTVVDCTDGMPVVLRSGSVSVEDLRDVVPEVMLAGDKTDAAPRSPGLRHRHYAPTATIVLVDRPPASIPPDGAFIGLRKPLNAESGQMKICSSLEEYAHELFHFFRACDAAGVRLVFCQTVPETGIGLALMDRLRRAAESA